MAIIWIILALAIFMGSLDLFIQYVYRYPKKPHQTTPAKLGIPFQEVRFPTKNDCHLYGWWIPAQKKFPQASPTLLLVHGWGRNVERMLGYIEKLLPRNYNLLVFDLRNHGSSAPDKFPNLLKFSEDIRAAVDFVLEQDSVNPELIGVLGLSIGGAAAIHAAAFDRRIKYIVTVGALAHPVDVMKLEFQKKHIPYFPLVWLFFKYLQFRMGINFNRIAPVNNIRKAQAKILLIHGEQDLTVPVEQGQKLKNAGNPQTTQLWVIPGKGHSDCHHHPEFWKRIESFLFAKTSA
jgi:pimeloyl-ACP methyl ester carboxylesterase